MRKPAEFNMEAKRPMSRRKLTWAGWWAARAHFLPPRGVCAGEQLKGLLDPIILPTVDQFPQITCGPELAAHAKGRCKAVSLRLELAAGFLIVLHICFILLAGIG